MNASISRTCVLNRQMLTCQDSDQLSLKSGSHLNLNIRFHSPFRSHFMAVFFLRAHKRIHHGPEIHKEGRRYLCCGLSVNL